jgi:hypothetical protein
MTVNPNYALLLQQIAQATDPIIKQQLIDQCFIFNVPLTQEEKDLFDYCTPGYITANPGLVGNSFKSYVGDYVSDNGEYTGETV